MPKLRRFDAVVYDCEIVRCVPKRDEPRDPNLAYCEGWHDRAGMGISVIGAIDLRDWTPHVFLADNFADFVALTREVEQLVGFNSVNFDDPLCQAHGLDIHTTYDLKLEVFAAANAAKARLTGEGRAGGRTLDELARANLGTAKSLPSGAVAPILWQQGKYGEVIRYCLNDVRLTAGLVCLLPELIDPATGRVLTLREFAASGRQETLL